MEKLRGIQKDKQKLLLAIGYLLLIVHLAFVAAGVYGVSAIYSELLFGLAIAILLLAILVSVFALVRSFVRIVKKKQILKNIYYILAAIVCVLISLLLMPEIVD